MNPIIIAALIAALQKEVTVLEAELSAQNATTTVQVQQIQLVSPILSTASTGGETELDLAGVSSTSMCEEHLFYSDALLNHANPNGAYENVPCSAIPKSGPGDGLYLNNQGQVTDASGNLITL